MVSILYSLSTGTVSALVIDATLSQEGSGTVEVTKFPIEDGSNVNDHAILRPVSYRLEGVISNTPPIPNDVMEAGEFDGHAETAREILESIRAAKKDVTIDAGSKVYDRMVMTELRFPRDVETGDALKFSACFEQITKVTSQVATVPKSLGGSKVKGGKKPTDKASQPAAKKASVAKAALDLSTGKIDMAEFLRRIGG